MKNHHFSKFRWFSMFALVAPLVLLTGPGMANASAVTSPDLSVSSIELDSAPDWNVFPQVGETYQVGFGQRILAKTVVNNVGNAASDGLTVNYFVTNSSGEDKLVYSQAFSGAGTLPFSGSLTIKQGLEASFFTEGKNTLTVKVMDDTQENLSANISPDSNASNDSLSVSMAVNLSSAVPDLAVVSLDIPDKAVPGTDVLVKAVIKDLNDSHVSSYTITTSVWDPGMNDVVVDENTFDVGTIGPDGIVYKFNIDSSKFKTGENRITVQVEDNSGTESALENNSLSKSIQIAPAAAKLTQKYANGVLLRNKITGKIYLLKEKMKFYISSLQELRRYSRNQMYTVDDTVLSAYPDYSVKPYADGTILISKTTHRIYLVTGGTKYYIRTLAELAKYRLNKSFRVDESVLNAYQDSQ